MSDSDPALPRRRFVQICQYRTCLRSRSDQVLAAFQQYLSSDLMVAGSGCMGQCGSGPMVRVMPDNIWYCRVQPQNVEEIVKTHCQGNQPVKRLLHPRFHPQFEARSNPLPPPVE